MFSSGRTLGRKLFVRKGLLLLISVLLILLMLAPYAIMQYSASLQVTVNSYLKRTSNFVQDNIPHFSDVGYIKKFTRCTKLDTVTIYKGNVYHTLEYSRDTCNHR